MGKLAQLKQLKFVDLQFTVIYKALLCLLFMFANFAEIKVK